MMNRTFLKILAIKNYGNHGNSKIPLALRAHTFYRAHVSEKGKSKGRELNTKD